MTLEERIQAFAKLGEVLSKAEDADFKTDSALACSTPWQNLAEVIINAGARNPWFTQRFIREALSAWAVNLSIDKITHWLSHYNKPSLETPNSKSVAVIMAGNIPLVGMHDFVSTLLAGHRFVGKLSKDDNVLLPAIASILLNIEPGFEKLIVFTEEKLPAFDAVIATGSNNTSRYFEYYFSSFPHIIRANRNGIGVITGNETEDDLSGFAKDICLYFGLGCRSISRLFFPKGYDPVPLLQACQVFEAEFANHFKYMNNYTYQKTLLQMNLKPYYDNGFQILSEADAYSSPVSVLHYSWYDHQVSLAKTLEDNKSMIQCVASVEGEFPLRVNPGFTQMPELWEYADGVDTMDFLLKL